MNIYLFGKFCSGYTQYPNDDSNKVFEKLYSEIKADTQIAIHRDGNLMYYAYIRKISEHKYCGICIQEVEKYYTDIEGLFSVFESCIEQIVCRGNILCFDTSGNVTTNITELYTQQEDIVLVTSFIKNQIMQIAAGSKDLPPVDYSISRNTVSYCCIMEDKTSIIFSSYTFGTTIILKESDYNTVRLNGYRGVLSRVTDENKMLRKENGTLKTANIELRAKQKNFIWVSSLGIVSAIMFIILYFEVLNPSEVTHYETGDFIYYGPLMDKKPHGVGVAIYPKDDKDGRKYYIGNFINGERNDSTAILFYQDGDYYYGSMKGDKWSEGLIYRRSDGTYFQGTFMNNEPFDGEWYDHVRKHSSVKGEVRY